MNHRINPYNQNPEDADKQIVSQNETIGSNTNCPPILKERYQTIKPLGESVWSRTFLAIDQDKPSKPPCIIKEFVNLDERKDLVFQGQEIIPTFSCDPVQLDKIGKHPQIPELLASVEHDGHRYLVQEYIEGRNMATELIEDGVFSENKIWQILNQLLPVLEFIHDHHLIHGDIKPENIICRTKPGTSIPEFVLVDFGVTISANGDLLSIGSINGSAEYAAPEQTQGKIYPNSDIYSLGATCLHLLTMVSPFELFDIKADKWVWRDYLKHPISRHLGRILDKMVQRDHRQRYQSAAEIIKDIKYGPTPVDVILQKPNWTVTAWGAAAIALLSLVISSRLQSPRPQPSISSSSENTTIPELKPDLSQPKIDEYTTKLPPLPPSTGILDQLSPLRTLATTSGPVWSIATSPDGRIVASGSTDGSIQLLHLRSGQNLGTLSGHDGPIWSVAITPDSRTLVSASGDSTIKIWDLYTGRLKNTLYGHLKDVFSVAVSPDGNTIASVSKDKTIKIWDINSGLLLYTLYGHLDEVQSVVFSPDGQTLASGSNDGTVKIWNWRYGRLLRTLKGHSGPVWSVAISPDGNTLASGSWDNTIKLWDLNTYRRRISRRSQRTLIGHSEKVQSLQFSPDGKTLASGDFGGTIKLWQIHTGGLMGTLKGHSAWVNLTFDPQGKTLISGSFDDTIKLWRFSPSRF